VHQVHSGQYNKLEESGQETTEENKSLKTVVGSGQKVCSFTKPFESKIEMSQRKQTKENVRRKKLKFKSFNLIYTNREPEEQGGQ